MTFPSDPDLIAHHLGHLDPPTRERVERALAADPDLAARRARIGAHLALYDALDAPPPPRFAAVAGQLTPRAASRPHRLMPAGRAAWAVGTAAALVVVGLAVLLVGGTPTDAAIVGRAGEGIVVLEGGRPADRPTARLRAGDVIRASVPAEAWLGTRIHLVLDANATLALVEETVVRLQDGRAFFEVEPGPFTVRTRHGDVRVLGTTFEVAVSTAGVEVRVASGRVAVAGRTIEAGMALRGSEIGPLDERMGAWFRQPVLRLAVADGPPSPGQVALRFTFENPGHVPIEVASAESVTAALWLQVEDPASVVHDVAVAAAGSGTGPLPSGRPLRLGPGAATSFTLRFSRPFDQEGAYRCRAMYRPDGDPPLLSDELLVEVR